MFTSSSPYSGVLDKSNKVARDLRVLEEDKEFVRANWADITLRFENNLKEVVAMCNKNLPIAINLQGVGSEGPSLYFCNDELHLSYADKLDLKVEFCSGANSTSSLFRCRRTDRVVKPNGQQVISPQWYDLRKPAERMTSEEFAAFLVERLITLTPIETQVL